MVMTWGVGGGGGWLKAIVELVDHFHRPSWMCLLIKTQVAAAELIKLAIWLHLGITLLLHCVLSISF